MPPASTPADMTPPAPYGRVRVAIPLWREAEVAGDGLRPVDRAELAEDVPHMRLDSALRDHEMVGDLRVRGTDGEQPQHIAFPLRQLLGAGAAAPTDAADRVGHRHGQIVVHRNERSQRPVAF